jgi:hypothetical protein
VEIEWTCDSQNINHSSDLYFYLFIYLDSSPFSFSCVPLSHFNFSYFFYLFFHSLLSSPLIHLLLHFYCFICSQVCFHTCVNAHFPINVLLLVRDENLRAQNMCFISCEIDHCAPWRASNHTFLYNYYFMRACLLVTWKCHTLLRPANRLTDWLTDWLNDWLSNKKQTTVAININNSFSHSPPFSSWLNRFSINIFHPFVVSYDMQTIHCDLDVVLVAIVVIVTFLSKCN